MATWKKWTSTVLVNGQPEPNVEVHVYEPGTTNEITVYEDEGVTPITQPILTDSQGRYAFFVDVDTYPEIRLYLEKDGVDFSEANEDLDGVPVPGAGAGAGTFLALSDTPSSYVGRGGDVVLVKTTEDGIETQPWPVTGTILNFFLSDDAADIGSYYYMYPTESGNGYSELTSPSLSTGDDQLLWAFVTEAGEPGVEVLALGAYTATLFLKKTGNKDVRLYWKLFKRDTGGTETEILQSAVSDYLTADNSQYLISAYLNEDQVLDPTDRLVLKLYANVSGTGTDVTVTLTMEGDYDSRLTINVLSSAFNLDRLSDVTITSPSNDELLAYDSGSGKWINQTPSEAGVLAADGSVPLTGDLDFASHSALNLKSAMGILNVKGFGAKGDGVSDDTSAIQDAIDAAAEAGGGIVLFPEGAYVISSPLSINASHITLLGIGAEKLGIYDFKGSILYLDENFAGDAAIVTSASAKITDFHIRGLGLRCNQKADGLWLYACRGVTLHNVYILQPATYHVKVMPNSTGFSDFITIDQCHFESGGILFYYDDTADAQCTDITIMHSVLSGKGNAPYCLEMQNVHGALVLGNYFGASNGTAISIESPGTQRTTENIEIIKNLAENTGTFVSISGDSNAYNVSIRGLRRLPVSAGAPIIAASRVKGLYVEQIYPTDDDLVSVSGTDDIIVIGPGSWTHADLKNKISGTGTIVYATPVLNLSAAPLLDLSDSNFPVARITRDTSASSDIVSSLVVKAKTNSDMSDGFGGGIVFAVEDDAGTENLLAGISGVRWGADNQGRLFFRVFDGSAWQSPAYVSAEWFKTTVPLFYQVPNSAPSDSSFSNSQCSAWVDEATNELVFKVRLSDGTFKTGRLSLA